MPSFRMLIAGVFLLLASCQQQPQQQPTKQTETQHSSVPLRLASWDETDASIAKHKGKVVVLDVWSTWCGPCVEEFPGLVALHKKHGDKVACISLNCNYTGAEGEPPGSDRKDVEAFLSKQGATFDNVICTDADEKLFMALDAAAIPIVRVYDREGKLRKQFDNDEEEFGKEGFSYEKHIAPLVEQILHD